MESDVTRISDSSTGLTPNLITRHSNLDSVRKSWKNVPILYVIRKKRFFNCLNSVEYLEELFLVVDNESQTSTRMEVT